MSNTRTKQFENVSEQVKTCLVDAKALLAKLDSVKNDTAALLGPTKKALGDNIKALEQSQKDMKTNYDFRQIHKQTTSKINWLKLPFRAVTRPVQVIKTLGMLNDNGNRTAKDFDVSKEDCMQAMKSLNQILEQVERNLWHAQSSLVTPPSAVKESHDALAKLEMNDNDDYSAKPVSAHSEWHPGMHSTSFDDDAPALESQQQNDKQTISVRM